MKSLLPLLCALFFINSCANMSYNPRIESYGEMKDSSTLEEQASNMKWADAKGVKAYLGKLPAGISVNNDGIQTDDQWENLGKVYTNMDGYTPVLGWPSYPEDQSWRNGYCKPQQVLVYATFFLWPIIPLYYPCICYETNSTSSVSKRKMRIVHTLKKMVKAAGGDTLIITSLGKTSTINANTKEVLSTLDMTGAEGYALRSKKK